MPFDFASVTYVLVAGASALLSPCGFPMLPGYVSYYLGAKSSPTNWVSGGIACTLGLVLVFALVGTAASIVGAALNPYIPLLELVAGVVTIGMGITTLFGKEFLRLTIPSKAPRQKGLVGIFLYGVTYGLATLGCSAPVFFAVLFWAITSDGILGGVFTFVVYAVGMGLPLISTTILVSLAKERMLRSLMKALPKIQKASGVFLILIGVYLLYFYVMTYAAL